MSDHVTLLQRAGEARDDWIDREPHPGPPPHDHGHTFLPAALLSGRRPSRFSALHLLVITDVIAFGGAFLLAQLLASEIVGHSVTFGSQGGIVFLATLPALILVVTLNNLYSRNEERPDHSVVDDFGRMFNAVTAGVLLFVVVSWIALGSSVGIDGILVLWGLTLAALLVTRVAARTVINRRLGFVQNVVIVGAGDVGQLVATKMIGRPGSRLNLVGFVDDDPRPLQDGLEHVALLGSTERLPALIELLDVDRVMIAFSRATNAQMVSLIRGLKDYDVQVDIVPRLFDSFGTRASLHMVEGLPLVGLPALRLSRPALAVKRSMDVIVSGAALLTLSPLLLLVGLLVRRDSPGPVFYRHMRVGQDGEMVGVFKFRTMHAEFCRGAGYGGDRAETAFSALMADPDLRQEFETNFKLARDPRVTRIGAFLRRTSIDELPQLLNVLRGDLSLVGPRPVTTEELPRYGGESTTLLNAKPGLTGFWQISGRSDTSYEERVRLDLAYVTSWSLKSDLSILVKTFRKVFLHRHGAF
jgi:exopolysaccharide biosynthesis polyprenyl glycosylphosphotransferase